MKIVFWSNVHGQPGTSSNMLAAAMMNDLMYRNRSILLQTQFELNDLEIPLLSEARREQIRSYNVGVDRLIQGIRSGMSAKQLLTSSCISLARQCIDFLPGTNVRYKEIFDKEIRETFRGILSLAQDCYEMVFVDASTEISDFMDTLFEEADLIVVNLSQNRRVIEDFLHKYTIDYKKMVFLFGNYDPDSDINVRNVCNRFKNLKKELTFVLPYNTDFRDAASKASLSEFFLQNMGCEEDDENYYFIEELMRFVYLIHERNEECSRRPRYSMQRRAVIGGLTSDY